MALERIPSLSDPFIEFHKKAIELEAKTIAFCAIGTGGKGLNQHEAAQCAVDTVLKYGKSFDKVCFNVFTDISEHAYRNRLSNLSLEAGETETVTPIDEPVNEWFSCSMNRLLNFSSTFIQIINRVLNSKMSSN